MTMRLAVLARNTQIDAFTALLNGGTIEVRTGSRPATPDDAATGTLLATLTFANPAFGAAAAASATANAVAADNDADAGGTAGYARLKTSGGVAKADCTVSASGGGGEVQLSTVTIAQHDVVNCTSCSVALALGS